jgi:hypothetical protein
MRHGMLVMMVLALATPAAAQVDLSGSVFYGSPYVWRGQVFSTGFVMQPTVGASYGGFSLSFFGNIDPRSGLVQNKMHVQEADLTAAYAAKVRGLALEGGYTLYTFPQPTASGLELQPTQEVFLQVEAASGALRPVVFAAYDFDAIKGLFAEAGLDADVSSGGHLVTLGGRLALDHRYLADDTSPAFFRLSADTAFSLGGIAVRPLMAVQYSLSDAYRAQISGFGHGRTMFFGGIGLEF